MNFNEKGPKRNLGHEETGKERWGMREGQSRKDVVKGFRKAGCGRREREGEGGKLRGRTRGKKKEEGREVEIQITYPGIETTGGKKKLEGE